VLHIPEKSGFKGSQSWASKDFGKLDLNKTANCTTSDRFMDHKTYKTPCNSLYGRPEVTIDRQQNCLQASLSCKPTSEFLGLFLGLFGWLGGARGGIAVGCSSKGKEG